MLKKMRWRFVGAAMAAFSAVILVLLCFINLWYYGNVTGQQDRTLERLFERETQAETAPPPAEPKTPMPDERMAPPIDTMGQFSPEVRYMVRFFSVCFDGEGQVQNINQDFIASLSEEDAQKYAADILKGNREKGYYKGYRYLVKASGKETYVVCLNSEKELQGVRLLMLITGAIAGGSLVVVSLLVILFSKRATAPYLKNMEAQKQFITNAGHELKTPLTAISTSADVLAMELEENEWVQNIQKQSAKLSKRIGSLVMLSRLDEENPFPEKTEFSLSEAVWEISEPFGTLAKAKGKQYSQEIQDNVMLHGDRTAIQQMVSILLDNAVKYSKEGGEIRLYVSHNAKKAEIRVFNTCDHVENIGVSRLFDRFYRQDEAHSDKTAGSGIGLSIVRATVQAHGGTVRAEKKDGGLLFVVRL